MSYNSFYIIITFPVKAVIYVFINILHKNIFFYNYKENFSFLSSKAFKTLISYGIRYQIFGLCLEAYEKKTQI